MRAPSQAFLTGHPKCTLNINEKENLLFESCLSYIYILVLSNLYFQYSTKICFGNFFFSVSLMGYMKKAGAKAKCSI